MHVVSLHRYPVKSTTGEHVAVLELDRLGALGDRRWAVRTSGGAIGSGKRTRRFAPLPGLLAIRSALRDDHACVVLSDGRQARVDDPDTAALLSRHLGQPVTLAAQNEVSHLDDGPVSLLGIASVRAVEAHTQHSVEPDRFRPNVVLATRLAFEEEEWIGRQVRLGSAVLTVTMVSPRCVMVDAETADLPAAPGVLQAVGQVHQACLGVIADVVEPGTVRIGDVLALS